MTWKDFEAQMDRMGGLKFRPAEMQTHWEGLKDLPDAVLVAAIGRAIKTRVDFPTPAELREDADAVAHLVPRMPEEDRGEDLPEPVALGTLPDGTRLPPATRVWRYACEVCHDTGWKPVEHRTVTRCPCFETNPVLVRKRERDRRYAEAKAARR